MNLLFLRVYNGDWVPFLHYSVATFPSLIILCHLCMEGGGKSTTSSAHCSHRAPDQAEYCQYSDVVNPTNIAVVLNLMSTTPPPPHVVRGRRVHGASKRIDRSVRVHDQQKLKTTDIWRCIPLIVFLPHTVLILVVCFTMPSFLFINNIHEFFFFWFLILYFLSSSISELWKNI